MDARWKKIKDSVLGKNYELSLVLAEDKLMRKLNRQYRKKDKTTNVLSFGIERNLGEIFLNKGLAKKEAEKAGVSLRKYASHLFTHSVLHLKGYEHGEKMDKEEERLLKKFIN